MFLAVVNHALRRKVRKLQVACRHYLEGSFGKCNLVIALDFLAGHSDLVGSDILAFLSGNGEADYVRTGRSLVIRGFGASSEGTKRSRKTHRQVDNRSADKCCLKHLIKRYGVLSRHIFNGHRQIRISLAVGLHDIVGLDRDLSALNRELPAFVGDNVIALYLVAADADAVCSDILAGLSGNLVCKLVISEDTGCFSGELGILVSVNLLRILRSHLRFRRVNEQPAVGHDKCNLREVGILVDKLVCGKAHVGFACILRSCSCISGKLEIIEGIEAAFHRNGEAFDGLLCAVIHRGLRAADNLDNHAVKGSDGKGGIFRLHNIVALFGLGSHRNHVNACVLVMFAGHLIGKRRLIIALRKSCDSCVEIRVGFAVFLVLIVRFDCDFPRRNLESRRSCRSIRIIRIRCLNVNRVCSGILFRQRREIVYVRTVFREGIRIRRFAARGVGCGRVFYALRFPVIRELRAFQRNRQARRLRNSKGRRGCRRVRIVRIRRLNVNRVCSGIRLRQGSKVSDVGSVLFEGICVCRFTAGSGCRTVCYVLRSSVILIRRAFQGNREVCRLRDGKGSVHICDMILALNFISGCRNNVRSDLFAGSTGNLNLKSRQIVLRQFLINFPLQLRIRSAELLAGILRGYCNLRLCLNDSLIGDIFETHRKLIVRSVNRSV